MVESMKKIQELSTEVEGLKKISCAAADLINLVDHVGEDIVEKSSLLQRLQEAPLKFSSYVTETTKSYVLTALGLLSPSTVMLTCSRLLAGWRVTAPMSASWST